LGYAGQWIVERSAEELLLEYERTGRSEPFEEIVRRYSGMVYHVCHRICRDKHDAEDATQAVFAALAVGRKKESGEIRTIGPWLRQVARRVSLDIRRGKKRRQRRETLCATDGASVDPRPEPSTAGLDAEEVKQLVKEELERLPVKYRLPLILHYFGGMSQEDMAKELGCRPGTLRVRLHRGRGMLAKRLAKRGVAVGGLGMVVLAVAITRAVQSAVTDSLAAQFGYGPAAATAGGVIQAATSAPVAVVQGVATATKVKVGLAALLVGACVVRAGAEVYEYIRPMQLRVKVPVNLDRVVQPLIDTFTNPMRVDANPSPAAPPTAAGGADHTEVAIESAPGPVLTPRPAGGPVATGHVLPREAGRVVGSPAIGPGGGTLRHAAQGRTASVDVGAPGRVGPAYSRPMVWTPPVAGVSTGSGGGGGGGKGATEVAERTHTAKPPSEPAPGKTGEGPTPTPTPEESNPAPIAEVPPTKPSSGSSGGGGETQSSSGGKPPVMVASAISLRPTDRVEMPTPMADGGASSGTTNSSSAVTNAWTPMSATDSAASVSFQATPSAYTMGAAVSRDYVSSTGVVPVVLNVGSWVLRDSVLASNNLVMRSEHPHVAALSVSSSAADAPQASTPVRTFRVERTGITGYGVVSSSSVDNNGIVTATAADGPVAEPLDLSLVGAVTNTIDNPPNGRNGWYAGTKAKLVLPRIRVAAGTHAYSWGEAPSDPTPDLVNSVRLTLYDVAGEGDVALSLVAPDWPGVPALPADQRAIGLWSFDLDGVSTSGVDLLVRYDAYQAYLLGRTDQDVRLMEYTGSGWQAVDDASRFVAPAEHLIGGHVEDAAYFAVTVPTTASTFGSTVQFTYSALSSPSGALLVTPEPMAIGAGVAAGALLCLRRRRRV
jgi:RNA polymerase sigma factor (sigma-70 family)